MTIGEVARAAGIRPSAIRYYESQGLLEEPERVGGRRRYGGQILDQLAVIRYARCAGFTMAELRELVSGFSKGTRASVRWQKLARRKIDELDRFLASARQMRGLLERALRCRCLDLTECGVRIRARRSAETSPTGLRRP